MKFFSRLLKRPAAAPAHNLYRSLVEQSRRPGFYEYLGVPDTLDGRFEMVAIHAFLVLRALKGKAGEPVQELAERVVEVMFADMDQTLREMGVGDLGVGKRVKMMASSFYGRIAAYDAGLAGEPGVLEEALRRNLYGTSPVDDDTVRAMAEYVRGEAERQKSAPPAQLLAGSLAFGAVPERASQIR